MSTVILANIEPPHYFMVFFCFFGEHKDTLRGDDREQNYRIRLERHDADTMTEGHWMIWIAKNVEFVR